MLLECVAALDFGLWGLMYLKSKAATYAALQKPNHLACVAVNHEGANGS